MEYLALYRKYRPKELEEVVGQNEIKRILASSVKHDTITHAYLFSGPRGTGKTTMAKILAKMVNCEHPVNGHACNKCNTCLNILNSNDVIEIDAASNNGVDEIRDLREKANLVPSTAKYKVYIVDEVHMLTTQAFNALLKTLEEPPKHVIFILATTEYYKIPLTITSRCQKFQFNKICNDDIVNRLKEIANLEKIDITEDALFEIAKISDGGMRDSINFLDQLRSFNTSQITINDVYDVCGNVSVNEVTDLFNNIRENNAENVTSFFENMNLNGKNFSKFFEDIIGFLNDVILAKKNVNNKYIHNDIDSVRYIANLFNVAEIFKIIENINKIMEKCKVISRQSTFVISNMLLLMYDLNEKNNISDICTNNKINLTSNQDNKFVNSNDNGVNMISNSDNSINDRISKDNIYNNNLFLKNKDIIINNTFALASKNVKNNLQEKFDKISDYLTDKKYMAAVGALIDTNIEVAGAGYLILSAMNDAIIDKIYKNYYLCLEFLNKLFDEKFNFVVISQDEWNILRDQYIKNIRNGTKYYVKKIENTLIDDNVVSREPSVVDKLFQLVGEDVIEFK